MTGAGTLEGEQHERRVDTLRVCRIRGREVSTRTYTLLGLPLYSLSAQYRAVATAWHCNPRADRGCDG